MTSMLFKLTVLIIVFINLSTAQYNSRDGRKTRYPGRESVPSRYQPNFLPPTIAQTAEEYWVTNQCEYPPKDFYPLYEAACALPAATGDAFIVGLCQGFFNSSKQMCHLEGYGEDERQTVSSITALQATIDDDSICDTLTKLNDQDPELIPQPTGDNEWFKATHDILFSDLCSSACSFSRLHPLCFGFLLNYDVMENKKVEDFLNAAEEAKRQEQESQEVEEVIIVEAPNLENSTSEVDEGEISEVSSVIINEIQVNDDDKTSSNENDNDGAISDDDQKTETPGETETKENTELENAKEGSKTINPKFFPFKDSDPNFLVDYDYGDFFDDEILNNPDRDNLVISNDIYKDREFITKLLEVEEDILNGSDGEMDLFDSLVDTPKRKKQKKTHPYPTFPLKGGPLTQMQDDDFSMLNMFLLISTLFLMLAAVIVYNHRRGRTQRDGDGASRRILQANGGQRGPAGPWNYERVINNDDDDHNGGGYH